MNDIDKLFLNWVLVTSVFFSEFETHKERPEYKKVYRNFMTEFGYEPNNQSFSTWDQGSIFMTLYGAFCNSQRVISNREMQW